MLGNLRPEFKLTFVGGGIISAMIVLMLHQRGIRARVTVYDKNPVGHTTAELIAASLTVLELMAVIPPGPEFEQALHRKFDEAGGIAVTDVDGVMEGTEPFIAFLRDYTAQQRYSQDKQELLDLGTRSMMLWDQIFREADPQLRQVFMAANYMPCREPESMPTQLGQGYRVDLLSHMPDPIAYAQAIIADHEPMGYKYSRMLTPDEAMTIDPSLAHFCFDNSYVDDDGVRVWWPRALAVLRPGGRLDVSRFLPALYEYLAQNMGTYTKNGIEKLCFRFKPEREVTGFTYAPDNRITGLFFGDRHKSNSHPYPQSRYWLCPGESVSFLAQQGFKTPPAVGFAGPSLWLTVPLDKFVLKGIVLPDHAMEYHQPGIVLAWQAFHDKSVLKILVGGTKAFYGHQQPQLTDEFAQTQHLKQLNMINEVFPQVLSVLLECKTLGKQLTQQALLTLCDQGFVQLWINRRSVTPTGKPVVAQLSNARGVVSNGFYSSFWGSGGVSGAPAGAEEAVKQVVKSLSTRSRL